MPLLTEKRIVNDPEEITKKIKPLLNQALSHGGPDTWTFDSSVHNAKVHRPESVGTFIECPREVLAFYLEELKNAGPTQNYDETTPADLERDINY
jgi:hypothetical protein